MEKTVNALTEHEVFIRELITLYKQKPVLWQQKHPHYRNRNERAEAFEELVRKAQEYYPEADEDYVRTKIESMRSSFRKERKKVLQSKENSNKPEEIHRPSLWYYDLLLFLSGEETENVGNNHNVDTATVTSTNPEDGQTVKIPFWSREHSAILINFYKNQPCLFSSNHPLFRNKRKRVEAVKKITEKLKETTGKFFHPEDVRRKISLIRGQYLHEYKKIKASESRGEVYTPTLWCFEMLSFLKDEYTNVKNGSIKRNTLHSSSKRKNMHKSSSSEASDDEDMDIKKESESEFELENHMDATEISVEDDMFDTIGKNLAHKLREMTEEQRTIANKLVREIMYHGMMEHLTVNSRFSLNGS